MVIPARIRTDWRVRDTHHLHRETPSHTNNRNESHAIYDEHLWLFRFIAHSVLFFVCLFFFLTYELASTCEEACGGSEEVVILAELSLVLTIELATTKLRHAMGELRERIGTGKRNY